MSNVATITNITTLASYLPDGVWQALEPVLRFLPRDIRQADNLLLYSNDALSTTKDEVDDDAGARPIFFIAQSQGTAGWLICWDADADDVTVGTTEADFVVPISGTSGEVTVVSVGGNGWKTFWNTGFTVAACTTVEGSSAMTNLARIWILYAGS